MELRCELGNDRLLVLEDAGRDDHIVRVKAAIAGERDVSVAVPLQILHGDTVSNRELEPLGVRLEVVGHVKATRKRVTRPRERHPGEAALERRRVQPQ
jgi:hypothetical protein